MKKSWEWTWKRIKIGAIPLLIFGIPLSLAMYVWSFFEDTLKSWNLHLFNLPRADVSLSILLILAICLSIGILLLRPKFQDFFRKVLPSLPIAGPILLRSIIPKEDLRLVEVQTYDGNWEYALCLHARSVNFCRINSAWDSLGFGSGRLFSRVAERNVRFIPAEKQHDAWMIVLSMGLLSGEYKDK